MGRAKKKPEYLKENAQKAKEAAKDVARAKVKHLVQSTYEDFPVFPYGYGDMMVAPDWVKAPDGFNREEFIRDKLSNDWLPTRPSREQFDNLYGQLHEYAFSISPHSLKGSRKCNVSAETVVNGEFIPEVKHDGTPVTSYIDQDMKNTYHIIRVWDARNGGRFLEFLRQNSTGYILAWRVYATLALFRSADWCYFCDEPAIVKDLEELWTFERTEQHSSYSVVEDTIFGIDSMELAIDHLDAVCQTPGMDEDDDTILSVHFFLLLLGEAPRSDIMKEIIFRTITSKTIKQCELIGLVFEGVVTNWNKVCKGGCLLRLMIIETLMAATLMDQRPNKSNPSEPHYTLIELFKEMTIHRRMAQHWCNTIVVHNKKLQQVYVLSKERGADGKFVYSNDAYKRIVDECISLFRYSDLVIGVMVREKPYAYPMFLLDKDDTSVKHVAAELLFWRLYKSFKKAHKAANTSKVFAERECQSCLVMRFLSHTTPFLRQWGYSDHVESALGLEEINYWCNQFLSEMRSGMGEVQAGKRVLIDWRLKRDGLNDKIKALVDFIGDNDLGD